ncbi:nickel insertion protein [Cytobacillus firmus]|uniref:nickel insertion protein n=1 Tax=Cytobacillus firmus TaxID=1399 RepID=UPI002494F35F|nr:nickel insertion protein [Cytobacillus firmus]
MTDLCAFLQANIDDQNPEILSYVMDRLLEDGANDVFFQPIVIKKDRNAVTVNILCSLDDIEKMEDILFKDWRSSYGSIFGHSNQEESPWKSGKLQPSIFISCFFFHFP